MVSYENLLLLGGLLLTVMAMASTAFWIVSSVRTTTAVLAAQISHLCAAVEKLANKLDREVNQLEIGQRDHEHRLTLLEQKCKSIPAL